MSLGWAKWAGRPWIVFLGLAVLVALLLSATHSAGGGTGGPSVSPPNLTNQNGVYVVFTGPGADQLAGAFQASAAKGGAFWSTFRQGPTDYQISCRLHYGNDSVEVAKSNAAFEFGIESSVCAALVANGWHQ